MRVQGFIGTGLKYLSDDPQAAEEIESRVAELTLAATRIDAHLDDVALCPFIEEMAVFGQLLADWANRLDSWLLHEVDELRELVNRIIGMLHNV